MSWSVANGSSHSQTGADEGRYGCDAHPAVDPQEESGDGRCRRAPGEPLDHDPGPADEADGAQHHAERTRHRDQAGVGRGCGAQVPGQHEDERQGDGDRRPGEVDGQRQRALVDGGEAVGGCDRRQGRASNERTGRAPRSARGDAGAAVVTGQAPRLRRSRYGADSRPRRPGRRRWGGPRPWTRWPRRVGAADRSGDADARPAATGLAERRRLRRTSATATVNVSVPRSMLPSVAAEVHRIS